MIAHTDMDKIVTIWRSGIFFTAKLWPLNVFLLQNQFPSNSFLLSPYYQSSSQLDFLGSAILTTLTWQENLN